MLHVPAREGGHLQVADFFMTPLLHIYSDDKDANKRVLKINRRYYKNPLYIEVPSRALLKKATIEEELIQLEAVNFTSGEEKHWTKIKEYMSRHFVTCSEILTYGNQQTDGSSRREDNMFLPSLMVSFMLSTSRPVSIRLTSSELSLTTTRTIIFPHSLPSTPDPVGKPISTSLFHNWSIKIFLQKNNVLSSDGPA